MDDASFVRIAKALSDPTRAAILRGIREAGEITCSGVCERFQRAQPTISHHLRVLCDAGLIKVREEGMFHVLAPREETLKAFAAGVLGAPAGKPRAKPARARKVAAPRAKPAPRTKPSARPRSKPR